MQQNILGKRISDLCQIYGLSQRELAGKVGVTEVSISRYVKGNRMPNGSVLAKLATALHTTVDDLMGVESRSDSESEYYHALHIIYENSDHWTPKQKAALVNAVFEPKTIQRGKD